MRLFSTLFVSLISAFAIPTEAAAQAPAAGATSHGVSCNGFDLLNAGYWDIGGTSYLYTGSAPAGAPTTIFLGVGAPLPSGLAFLDAPGCMLYTAPVAALVSFSMPDAGRITTPIHVPNDETLVGSIFTLQAVVATPGVNALGVSTSNAQVVTIAEHMGG